MKKSSFFLDTPRNPARNTLRHQAEPQQQNADMQEGASMQQTSTAVRIPQQTRSQQTRSKLLEAGLTLFVEEGFHKTTSKDIARQAGVAVGSFYAYFQDKRAVLQELLDAFAQQSWQNQAWEPAQCDDVQAHPKQMLLRMLKQQARMHEQSRDMRDIFDRACEKRPGDAQHARIVAAAVASTHARHAVEHSGLLDCQ